MNLPTVLILSVASSACLQERDRLQGAETSCDEMKSIIDKLGSDPTGHLTKALGVAKDDGGSLWRTNLIHALGHCGPPAVDALKALLKNPADRPGAVKALGHLGPSSEEARRILRSILTASDACAELALEAVGLARDAEAVPTVLKLISDAGTPRPVLLATFRALEAIGSKDALSELQRYHDRAKGDIRVWALVTCIALGADALESEARKILDSQSKDRYVVASYYARRGDADALDALIEELQADDSKIAACAYAELARVIRDFPKVGLELRQPVDQNVEAYEVLSAKAKEKVLDWLSERRKGLVFASPERLWVLKGK